MGDISTAIQGVLAILVMLVVGIGLSKAGWFSEEITNFATKFVVKIAAACIIFMNAYENLSLSFLQQMGALTFVTPIIYSFGIFGVMALVGKLARIPKNKQGIFVVCGSCANTIFVGLPVNLAIFGEVAIPHLMVYMLANTLAFWTLGQYFLSRDAGVQFQFDLRTVKNVLSPPLVSFLLGTALALTGIPLPHFITESARNIGAITTPLALIIIGTMLQKANIRSFRFDRFTLLVMAGRFLIGPLLCAGLCLAAGINGITFEVFVVTSGMPVMVQTAILSRMLGADAERASMMVALSTIGSLLFIPIMMFVI